MGECVVGKVLGMGSQRGVGIDLFPCLWAGFPPAIHTPVPSAIVFSCFHGSGVPLPAYDLFRGELPARRYAQLQLIHNFFAKKSNYVKTFSCESMEFG